MDRKQRIGKLIRISRKTAGLSQMELADRIGVSYQMVQKYEKGISEIGMSRLFQIARALNMPLGRFIPDDDKMMVSESVNLYGSLSDEEIELLKLFRLIKNKRLKEGFLAAVKSVASLPAKKGRKSKG